MVASTMNLQVIPMILYSSDFLVVTYQIQTNIFGTNLIGKKKLYNMLWKSKNNDKQKNVNSKNSTEKFTWSLTVC